MKVYYLFSLIIGLLVAYSCSLSKPPFQLINEKGAFERAHKIQDTSIRDTLAYIKGQFLDHKEKYRGKALQVLLDDLKIKVQSYTAGTAHNNRYIVPSITLSFLSSGETSYRTRDWPNEVVLLWIKWETPLPNDSASAIIKLKNTPNRNWERGEQQYYGKQIVKDFGIVDEKNK